MQLKGFSHFEVIAEGGMAVLYRATQTSLDRPVAIKVLKTGLLDTPQARQMFDREAQIVARLDHPNIIRVIDKGITEDGMPYFVMDYIEGETLSHANKRSDFTTAQKLRAAIQVAKALAYAHKNNIVHRDIKPGNVLIDREENARVVDFGIALITEDTDITRSEAGLTVGTLSYMAPEQHNGAAYATAASDIYSLGVMMYLMFAGVLPKLGYPPPTHYNPKMPEALSAIIMACLSEEAFQRPTAEQLTSMLLKSVQGQHLTPTEVEDARETFKDSKDKFRLLDVIRETPYGSVFLYENRTDHNLMVLKKRVGSWAGYHEAEWASRHRHPNIIHILGVSRNERIFIVVMEYLQGGSLQNRLAQPMALTTFFPIAEQLCDALIFAHQHHIVHGNLRPHNVLFSNDQQIKVTDFGLDQHYQESGEPNWYAIEEEPRSEKTDVFSAGVMFYQMLTGNLPLWRKGILMPQEAFQQLPQALQTVVKSMIFRDAEIRIGSFKEVKARLQEPGLQPPQPSTQEPPAASDVTTIDTVDHGTEPAATPPHNRKLLIVAVVLVSINMLLAGWFILGRQEERNATPSQTPTRFEAQSVHDESFLQPAPRRSE